MLMIKSTFQFRHDYRLAKNRGYPMERLGHVIDLLLSEKSLPIRYLDRQLSGVLTEYRECRIERDCIVIYRKAGNHLIFLACRIGIYADLFYH